MLPILKNHDRKKFEIWCIDSTPIMTGSVINSSSMPDHWINIKHLNGLQAARRISDEQLDILIELGGFTGAHVLIVWSIGHAPFN